MHIRIFSSVAIALFSVFFIGLATNAQADFCDNPWPPYPGQCTAYPNSCPCMPDNCCNFGGPGDDDDPPWDPPDPPGYECTDGTPSSQCGGSCSTTKSCTSTSNLRASTICPACISHNCTTATTSTVNTACDTSTTVTYSPWVCTDSDSRQRDVQTKINLCQVLPGNDACGFNIVNSVLPENCPAGELCLNGACGSRPIAVISASPLFVSPGQAVAFDGTASFDPDNQLPLSYSWDFKDFSTGINATESHTYQFRGSYAPSLTVTDFMGFVSDPAAVNVIADNAPVADFLPVPRSGVTPLTVDFVNRSTDPDNDPLTFSWNFAGGNNGLPSYEKEPKGIIFSTPGTYNVILIADDGLLQTAANKTVDTGYLKAIRNFYISNAMLSSGTETAQPLVYFSCESYDSTDLLEVTFLDTGGKPLGGFQKLTTNCMDSSPVPAPEFALPGIYKAEISLIPSAPGKACINCPKQTTFIIAGRPNVETPETSPLLSIAALGIALGIIYMKR